MIISTNSPKTFIPAICATAFVIFSQTFMIAPILPHLSKVFSSPIDLVALAVPAYIIPQGIATLLSGPLSDRFSREKVIYTSLILVTFFVLITAFVNDVHVFIGLRIVTGLSAAGIVPICLTLIGDVVPFEKRGKAVGWMFGAIAGGTATGAAVGALLEPVIGWRGLFFSAFLLATAVILFAYFSHAFPTLPLAESPNSVKKVLKVYGKILTYARARRTYFYVLLNAILQSGVFTWMGVYLHKNYGLDETGIGLALLGYGVPGLIFGPIIGKLADKYGRSIIIPSGVALTGICAFVLSLPLELLFAQIAIILLSLGFDLSHPQLAAIATNLEGPRGQTVALMAFSLFTGFGLGSLLFQLALLGGFTVALCIFGSVAIVAAGIAFRLFREERKK